MTAPAPACRRSPARSRAALAATAAAFALAAVGLLAPAPAVAAQAAAGRKLDRALAALVQAPGGPRGIIAIVHRPGHRTVHRAGVAQLGRPGPIRAGDQMRIASTAKAFSGAVALTLARRGKLKLGDTIGRRLPSLPRAWRRVTLAEALHHTSGLPDFSQSKKFQNTVRADPTHSLPPRRLLSFVARRRLEFRPGTRYRYSNSDNIVVALMSERVTGQSYRRLLRRLVERPLGLRRTSLPTGARMPRPFFHGYAAEDDGTFEDVSEIIAAGLAWASGGVVSTPRDLDVFARGYVPGRLATPRLVRRQRTLVAGTSEPPGPGRNAAGLAIFRYRTRCGTVWGHTGNTPGYTQFFAATSGGRRSVTVSTAQQLTPKNAPRLFPRLRHAELLAVCAALPR